MTLIAERILSILNESLIKVDTFCITVKFEPNGPFLTLYLKGKRFEISSFYTVYKFDLAVSYIQIGNMTKLLCTANQDVILMV